MSGSPGSWKVLLHMRCKKRVPWFSFIFTTWKGAGSFLIPFAAIIKTPFVSTFLCSLILPSSDFQLTLLPSASWNCRSLTFHPSLSLSSYSALLLGHLSICFNIKCGQCQLLSVELAKEHLGVGAEKKFTVSLGESQGWNSCLGVPVAWKVL